VRFLLKLFTVLVFCIPLKAGGFDDLGNSARAVSLGGAFIAVADAPYALFYNPAGIYRIKELSISTTYSNLYPDVSDDNLNYFSLSAAVPIGIIGEFGIGGTFLNTELWKENIFIATYAREVYSSFAVGGSFKLLRWSAEAAPGEEAMSYLGFTFDAGVHYTIPGVMENTNLQLGASIQNITQPSIASNGSDDAKLPILFGAGIALVSQKYNYIITVDAVRENKDFKIKAGAEFLSLQYNVFNLETGFLLRLGYDGIVNNSPFKQSGLNGGFGLNVNDFKIDYAYVFPLELRNVGGSHKISLSYKFNY